MENSNKNPTNHDIQTGPLVEVGSDWILRRLRQFNDAGDYSLSGIRRFFRSRCSNLKPQSLRTLAFGFKRSVKETLGSQYHIDPETRYIVDSFFAEYQKLRPVVTQRKFICQDDIAKLIAHAGPKTRLLIALLYTTGLRVSEACSIRLSKIIPGADVSIVHVFRKGGNEWSLIVPSWLIESARETFCGKKFLLETSGERAYSRQEVYNMLKDASLRYLGYSVHPHMFRHAFATHMVSRHPDKIEAIMRHGGWTNPTTLLKTYVHQSLDISDLPDLREAM